MKSSLLVLVAMVLISPARAATESLEDGLKALELPANQAPAEVSQEKLYSVQGRYSPLRLRHELSVHGSLGIVGGDGLISSQELGGTYRFHLSDRWHLGLSGTYVFNQLTGSANRLIAEEGVIPDVSYAKWRTDLTAGFHTFYGKFRITMDTVLYFDHYIAAGAAWQSLSTHDGLAGVLDTGFVFWFGKHWSVRAGLKDYLFEERRVAGNGFAQNLNFHMDVGFVLGNP